MIVFYSVLNSVIQFYHKIYVKKAFRAMHTLRFSEDIYMKSLEFCGKDMLLHMYPFPFKGENSQTEKHNLW